MDKTVKFTRLLPPWIRSVGRTCLHSWQHVYDVSRGEWRNLRGGDIRGLWWAVRHRAMIAKWYREGGEKTLRFNYPLTCESTVSDIENSAFACQRIIKA